MDLISTAEEYLKAISNLSRKTAWDKIRALQGMLSASELYRAGRIQIEALFTPEGKQEAREPSVSPSGRYKLIVTTYKTEEGTWAYSKGEVSCTGKISRAEKKIPAFAVLRNYRAFPFAWVEDHPDGHDYLVCGENYQGYTILQLDTGERADYFPPEGHEGRGWCSAVFHPSPGGELLAVEGCCWGGPYETRIYDFRNPLGAPPLIVTLDASPDFMGWESPTSCKHGTYEDWCIPLQKWEGDLTEEEDDEYIIALSDKEYEKVWKKRQEKNPLIWVRPEEV